MATTYKESGVDIDAGEYFAQRIGQAVRTQWPQVRVGGFADGGAIPEGASKWKGGVDGVGTKLWLCLLARRAKMSVDGRSALIGPGIDAVAMSAVDMFVSGATPEAIFDYLAVEHLEPDLYIELIRGLIAGCELAGCYLAGGETAEHPSIGLHRGHVDIATFCVGFAQSRPEFVVGPGMNVWGWYSHGLGSNGYSLARRVLKLRSTFLNRLFPFLLYRRLRRWYPELDGSLAAALLQPTEIYIKSAARAEAEFGPMAHAHITGGGLPGNVPRVLPPNCVAELDALQWRRPPIFDLIQRRGKVAWPEMYRSCNMGIQMITIAPADVDIGSPSCVRIGHIRPRQGDEPQVQILNMEANAAC